MVHQVAAESKDNLEIFPPILQYLGANDVLSILPSERRACYINGELAGVLSFIAAVF